MGIYDDPSRRTESAYNFKGNPDYLKNKFILKWWSEKHNNLLKKEILEKQWMFPWDISDKIVKLTGEEIINKWREEDPICRQYAWYNIIMYFAISKAEYLNLTKLIRTPQIKECPLCSEKFSEDSLPYPLVKILGIDNLDFCTICLNKSIFYEGQNNISKKRILEYIIELKDIINKIPSQSDGTRYPPLYSLSVEEKIIILKLLKGKPSIKVIKKKFGSWFNALVESGILNDDAQKMSRGIKCLAEDGDVCLSLGEKTIDDLLYSLGIEHEKEPKYPEKNYRADFLVNNIFIEYFGLQGNPAYDEKTKLKKKICKKHGIKLLELYSKDLENSKKLEKKILKAIN